MATRMIRGNGERLVPDEKVTEFLKMGYSVIDDQGNVTVEAEPSTIPQYKALVEKLRKENEALKLEKAEAEKELADLREAVKQQANANEKGVKSKDK